eukprot:6178557-Amphidinium_carterae.1
MTVVQEKQGAKKFAKPKRVLAFDVWGESSWTYFKLPTGVKNIYTVFACRAGADVEVKKPTGRLPEKLVTTVFTELDK